MAKSRLVAATVNGKGELVNLKFYTQAYRDMPPAELADAILDTVRRARTQMAGRVAELYQPFAPKGVDMQEVMEGRFDPAELFRRYGGEQPPPR